MSTDTQPSPTGVGFFRQLRALSGGMTREVLRDPMTLFFSVGFPLMMATFFVVMAQVTWASGTGTLALAADEEQAAELQQALGSELTVTAVEQLDTSDEGFDAHIALDDQARTVDIEIAIGRAGILPDLEEAIAETRWAEWDVEATSIDGGPLFDPIAFILPAALGFALLSVALTGTAGSLVSLRANGTLRLLATTPARRSAVLLSLVPSRVTLAIVLLAFMGVAAVFFGLLEPLSMVRMLVTTALGMAMMLPLGYLLGGLLSSIELTNMLAALLTPFLLLATGVLFPWEVVSQDAAQVAALIPLGMLGDALRHDVIGGITQNPLWLNWVGMALTAVLLTALAARVFRWDTKEAP